MVLGAGPGGSCRGALKFGPGPSLRSRAPPEGRAVEGGGSCGDRIRQRSRALRQTSSCSAPNSRDPAARRWAGLKTRSPPHLGPVARGHGADAFFFPSILDLDPPQGSPAQARDPVIRPCFALVRCVARSRGSRGGRPMMSPAHPSLGPGGFAPSRAEEGTPGPAPTFAARWRMFFPFHIQISLPR